MAGKGISFAFQFTGNKELQQILDGLPVKIRKTVMRRAMSRGADSVLNKMQMNLVPHEESGLLSDSLGVKMIQYKSGATVAVIGPRTGFKRMYHGKMRNPLNYAHLVEYGTFQHMIHPLTKTVLIIGRSFKRAVIHPGSKPVAFMRRAWQSKRAKALQIIGFEVRKGIERLVRKQRKTARASAKALRI
tara:strand:+ start:3918 stop:4481 length:564 start_codon:yes stop_codon:yes gene_type:complete